MSGKSGDNNPLNALREVMHRGDFGILAWHGMVTALALPWPSASNLQLENGLHEN